MVKSSVQPKSTNKPIVPNYRYHTKTHKASIRVHTNTLQHICMKTHRDKLKESCDPRKFTWLRKFHRRNLTIPVSSIEREKGAVRDPRKFYWYKTAKIKRAAIPVSPIETKAKKQVSKICDPRKFYRDKQKHNGRSLLYFVVIEALTVVGVGREENKPALQREAVKLICSVWFEMYKSREQGLNLSRS